MLCLFLLFSGPPPADKKGAKPKKQLRRSDPSTPFTTPNGPLEGRLDVWLCVPVCRKRTLEPPPPADEGAPAASVVVERPTARYADLAGEDPSH